MNGAGGFGSGGAFFDSPGATFFFAGGEERLKPKSLISSFDEFAESVVFDTVRFEKFFALFAVHTGHFFFELSVYKNCFVWCNEVSKFFLERLIGEALFVDIEHVDDGFVGEIGDVFIGGVFFALSFNFSFGFFVGELEFEINNIDIIFGLGNNVCDELLVGSQDIVVFESADDMTNSLAFADVGEKFVAETFAF